MTEHISGEEMSAYLDSEETQTQRAQVEEHLRNCPDCSAESEQLGVVKKVVARSAETHTAPSDLLAKAFARIDQEARAQPRSPRWVWRRTMVPAFAALFVIAVIVVGNVYLTPEGWRISCADCVDLLPDYIAHALPSDEAHLVAAHLDVCPGCHEAYEKMLAEAELALTGFGFFPEPADLSGTRWTMPPGRPVVWLREEVVPQ